MKVLRLHAHGEFHLHDDLQPAPVAGEALVQVRAVGIYGSDFHWFSTGGMMIVSSLRNKFIVLTSIHGR